MTYSTADGTASTAAGDYAVGGPTVLGFAVGQATSSITIFTTDDSLDEGDETILILLSNPIGGQSVIGGGGTVTINDDGDAPPTVSLASATQSVAEATTTINVVVNLSGQSGLPIAVTYTVTDGTATGGGVDYTGTSPIIIAAGSTSGNITVDIVGEDTFEKDETFDVNITGVTTTDQTITSTAPTSTAVTIENDDKPVTAVDTGGTTEDAVLNVTTSAGVLINDPSLGIDATLTAVDFVQPAKGVVVGAADGSYSFDPNGEFESLAAGENEDVTFLYEARFTGVQTVDSDPTTTTITVTGVNDVPVAVNDFYSILPGVPRVVTFGEGLLSNDTDVDSTDTLGSAVVVTPIPGGEGQLTAFSADGSFTYDPEAFVGTTQFTYEMDDSQGATSNVATVTLSQGPTLIMTVTTSTVDEDSSQFVIDIELVNPSTTPSTANVNTVAGTASTSDFGSPSASSITLSQSVGTTTQITIPIINDAATPVREGDEWFYVTLSNPGGGAVIAGGPGSIVTSTLTIVDPADAPTFSIEDITVTEPSSSANADVV